MPWYALTHPDDGRRETVFATDRWHAALIAAQAWNHPVGLDDWSVRIVAGAITMDEMERLGMEGPPQLRAAIPGLIIAARIAKSARLAEAPPRNKVKADVR